MRVISAFAAVASLASLVQAQSFIEGFEPGPVTPGVAPIPAGWTSVNVSPGGPGTNPNWQVRNDSAVFPANTGATYAFANYNSSTGSNNISNWLISPLCTFNNGDTISFYTRTVGAVSFPDSLDLTYNTTGSTLPADFTNILLQINPTLTTTGYPTAWTQFTATITGLAAPTSGRFAFHYNPTNGGPLGANSDYIGVDDVSYQQAGAVQATNTTLGQGCYRRPGSFYEMFLPGATDLSNTTWTMTLNGSGGYDVVPGGLPYAPQGGSATVVTLGDDTSAAVGTQGVTIGSNGWVATGAGNSTAFTPAIATLLSNPASAFYFWHDYNPAIAGSGQVYYEEPTPTSAVVTFNGVYDYATTNPNFIRVEMLFGGPGLVVQYFIGFGTLTTGGNNRLVGYSPGGASLDMGSTDISAALLIQTFNPETLPLALTANTRPITGANWDLAVSNSALLDLIAVGTSDPNISDLFFLGLQGCGIRASLDLVSTGSTLSLPIPNLVSLLNFNLYANAISLAPGVNGFGALTSNGINGKIGNF